ncbi:MAG: caspase family protein, partial [Amylibacter sp.]
MRVRFKQLTAAFTLSLTAFAGSVSATELALIISNSDYDNLQGERRISRNHRDLVAAFKAQGYEVIEGVDLSRLEMQALVQRVDSVVDELSGIVVLCSTNTVTDGSQTWILPTDIGGDSAIEAAFGA